jgi:hypothetical protein
VSFWVCHPKQQNVKVEEGYTIGSLNLPSQYLPRDDSGEEIWPHVKDLHLPDVSSADLGLLIGVNVKAALVHLEVRSGTPDPPDAIRGPLGWAVLGVNSKTCPRASTSVTQTYTNVTALSLDDQVEQFRSTDMFGCKDNDQIPRSIQETSPANSRVKHSQGQRPLSSKSRNNTTHNIQGSYAIPQASCTSSVVDMIARTPGT